MSAAEVGPEVSAGTVNAHLPHLPRNVIKTRSTGSVSDTFPHFRCSLFFSSSCSGFLHLKHRLNFSLVSKYKYNLFSTKVISVFILLSGRI